ncbi:MAG TPA: RHS repeat-associated core domain-containing protein [Nitrospira sp.]|nr:RHS repeat-associated core domain-containing protein [Nitrospira sp.]
MDDYVSIPDSAVLDSLSTNATLDAWIKPELPLGAEAWLFARRDPFVSEGFSVALLQDGRMQLTVRTTTSPTVSGSTFRSTASVITFDQWQHVAAAVDTVAGTAQIWVNGQAISLTAVFGPATLSGTLFNVNQQYLGRRQDPNTAGGGGHFKGQLDEVRLYGRTLTLAEVQSRVQNQPVATYVYDALSRRTSLTLPNGIQTTYTYDPASQVTAISHQLTALSSQINKAEYGYNAVGNRTSLTDRRGPQNFGYDNLDRLTSASHPLLGTPQAFAYDPVGNRATGGSVVNAGNQLTADATHSYQYDDNGNLTRKTLLATGNYTQYTYDAENRLIKVEDFAAGNPTPAFTSTYRYDGLGRRIEKVANGQTKRYIYDGEDILLEYDGTSTLQARYTHGPGIDEPIAVTKGSSTFFYHQDGLGSVTDLTDSTGATAKSYAYDAYGSILESPGTLEQPYTYTGREFDAESGLSYYRARNYDPSSGRFLQKDPIGFSGGDINLYNYVGNNPARWIDPLGLCYPGDFVGGLGDMISGRSDMMDAGTKGADAYFHCRANCQASRRGLGGYHAAVIASALREMIQNEPPADRARDEAANAQGQCAGNNNPSADCYKGCDNLIPPSGIPQRHLPPHADPRHRYQPAGTPP